MTDLISRQAAIDALDNIKIPRNASWYPYYQQALTVMSRLPSAQPEQRWIPCSERLPEDDEIVLVSDGIDYAVAFWRSDADAWDDPLHGWLDSFGFEVKAWMPLPEPYGGDQNG